MDPSKTNLTFFHIYASTFIFNKAQNTGSAAYSSAILDVQSDVSTFQSSDFNQLEFPIDPQKDNNGHPSRYSQQAVSFLFGFIWMTIGCLFYILQHSLCMDPGEFSHLPTSEDFYGSNTHLVFQYSGEANQLFPVRKHRTSSLWLCSQKTLKG